MSDAQWCGQCFAPLGPDAPAVPEGPAGPAAPSPPGTAEAGAGPKRDATWPCQVCGAGNPLDADVCATCGSPFAASMRAHEERPAVRPRDAVVWSLIFPGLGHRLVGRSLDGFARGALFAMTAGMSVLLAFSASGGATAAVLIAFVLAAVGTYVLSAVEAARLAEGGDVMVASRVLLWVLVGMTFLSVGALAVAVMGASRR